MTSSIAGARRPLSEKEKEVLRLIVRGHDAKSIARHLDLSVHTVNERLRAARRKMAVSSSREAARLFLDEEEALAADFLVPTQIGEEPDDGDVQIVAGPGDGGGRVRRVALAATGVLVMILAVSLFLLASTPQVAPAPVRTAASQTASPQISEATSTAEAAAARQWLELVDQGRWQESWKATGSAFRRLNSVKAWADASEKVRVPLGVVVSRTLLAQESVPAPPSGYEMVKFRTSFANKADAVETVTLDREGDSWRVVGVTIG